ncbi:amidase [Caballeronia sp. LZ065]|uniref:amidase n=1 Tax=Caballeronia sp. LZ065 TaxID=3038571 RepID=UPI0028635A21|nr:amidase [Caballeronia sp. LZ065]MDR5781255.1 amidase [Caballeronia sp. LZ065]
MNFLAVKPLPADLEERRLTYTPDTSLVRPYVPLTPSFASGADSPRAYLERCLDAMAAHEPAVHAFVTSSAERARKAADAATERWRNGQPLSPVDGMPVVVKDMIETVDFPTEMNNPIFKGWSSRRDAAGVAALRQAGAVILGKTVTTEFACSNSGPTRNPYDSSRTPGGSSSGSAAAVGAGMCALGLGTQTIASTIRPASFCGVYALKATHGALHTGGVTPLAPTLDHLTVFGASLEDAWAGAFAVSSRAGGTPPHVGLRGDSQAPQARRPATLVRLAMQGWDETPVPSQEVFETAIARLRDAGVTILDHESDSAVAALDREVSELYDYSHDILAWETRWPFNAYRAHGNEQIGERIHRLMRRAADMTVADYEHAVARRAHLRGMVAAFNGRADGFISLSSSGPAIQDHAFTGSRSFANPWSVVGGPALSLPLLAVDDLPLGIQLAGFHDRDVELCASAGWIRDALI